MSKVNKTNITQGLNLTTYTVHALTSFVYFQFLGKSFFSRTKRYLVGSADYVCRQGNQGERHTTAAQTGVEQRIPQAAKDRVSASHYSLSLSAAVF